MVSGGDYFPRESGGNRGLVEPADLHGCPRIWGNNPWSYGNQKSS
jgi:hypothetical protein